MRYTKHDNACVWIEYIARAQRFADRFVSLPWVARLDWYARPVNPLLRDLRTSMSYYWVTTPAEYATDLVFKSPRQAAECRGRRRVRRRGRRRTEWVPLRKSVASLFRYRDVAQRSNARYLNALAQVDDPTPGLRGLDTITTRKHPAPGRTVKAFNPVARPDDEVLVALMSGEHAGHGFANRDLRAKLTDHLREDPKQPSAQISRLLHRLHVYGLVANIPRSRRRRRVGPAPATPLPRVLCQGRVKSPEIVIARSKEPTTEECALRLHPPAVDHDLPAPRLGLRAPWSGLQPARDEGDPGDWARGILDELPARIASSWAEGSPARARILSQPRPA